MQNCQQPDEVEISVHQKLQNMTISEKLLNSVEILSNGFGKHQADKIQYLGFFIAKNSDNKDLPPAVYLTREKTPDGETLCVDKFQAIDEQQFIYNVLFAYWYFYHKFIEPSVEEYLNSGKGRLNLSP